MSYEFDENENVIMQSLFTTYLLLVLLIPIIWILNLVFFAEIESFHYTLTIIIFLGCIVFIMPFFSFKKIILTSGDDINQLMKAMRGFAITLPLVTVLLLINLIIVFQNA